MIQKLIDRFLAVLSVTWTIDDRLLQATKEFVAYLHAQESIDYDRCEEVLVQAVNAKLELNKEFLKILFNTCARQGVVFNFHEKLEIRKYVNSNKVQVLMAFLKAKSPALQTDFMEALPVRPLTCSETMAQFKEVYSTSSSKNEICRSLFSAFVFGLADRRAAHNYFTNFAFAEKNYYEDFYDHLIHNEPDLLTRKEGLRVLRIDTTLLHRFASYRTCINSIFEYLAQSYGTLSNHSYMAIHIDLPEDNKFGISKWELFSQLQLFAEKFLERKIDVGYFHPDKIRTMTLGYLGVDSAVSFEKVNEGYTYKDCFILSEDPALTWDTPSHQPYQMLLLFQKNERDERLVPCPACRSKFVRGNSYPLIGIKSWECCNELCPEKSKFNRGKRYSLYSLIKQQALEDDINTIPLASVKRWRLDVLNRVTPGEVLGFLVSHYSLVEDEVVITNVPAAQGRFQNRTLVSEDMPGEKAGLYDAFFVKSDFFKRIYIEEEFHREKVTFENISPVEGIEIYNDHCLDVLRQFGHDTFDGAVTSPPYYNAKEYCQWPNIYCYLHDMYKINREVYRVLKPGGIYLFNLFDCFDNENSVVFSDMGKKRLILSGYALHAFKKIGFEIQGNIVWFKGEIQGKRNFNQGNFSPYYQAPLNSYEHIFVLGKQTTRHDDLPQLLCKKPVAKIIKGENVVGHEAPFPEAIPELLFDILGEKANYVLDPFGGTMTTSRVAIKKGARSVCIEKDSWYCQRAIAQLRKEVPQLL